MIDDSGRDEFFTEAQELIEAFSRHLLVIDSGYKEGTDQPETFNEAFRAIHTLKGLCGLFGAVGLAKVTHHLEDLLDEIRLGRLKINSAILDILFSSVELSHSLLAQEKETPGIQAEAVTGTAILMNSITGLTKTSPSQENKIELLDDTILSVLTEYEEHRLRTNLDAGLEIFRLRAKFNLFTIDTELNLLKERAREFGEVITYLPSGEASSTDELELDLLLATGDSLQNLQLALAASTEAIEPLATTRQSSEERGTDSVSPPLSVAPLTQVGEEVRLQEPRGAEQEQLQPHEPNLVRRAVRVDIRKLDRLMNVLGELAILKGSLQKNASNALANGERLLGRDLQRLHRNFERRLEDLQDGILEMRMVPLAQAFDRLARGVRTISRELNKEVRLVITGAETEIDKLIVEELSEPLLHMLRNAIDHGIEDHDERRKTGKPESGTIALNAYQKGNHVVLEVEDDGSGINQEELMRRAISAGSLSESKAQELDHEERLQLMFLPGVSTTTQVSEISGRGVGMDVVKTNIELIGGAVDLVSREGEGTTFTIKIPLTLAIVSALIVGSAGQRIAVPQLSVVELVRTGSNKENRIENINGTQVLRLRDRLLPVLPLNSALKLTSKDANANRFVIVMQVASHRFGLVVDEVFDTEEIVVKPISSMLRDVTEYSGSTILGDGSVI
ncbi:MAG: chemotaxis protein CheA, partial [Polyangiaceae bacterium]|nr:chemotaxis protein CheA [Polyangiaceae bacterium]